MTASEIKNAMIAAREEYIDTIRSEILGPGSEFSVPDAEHEIISTSPTSRYSVGILFPKGNLINQDNNETVPLEENEQEEIIVDSFEAEQAVDNETSLEHRQHSYASDETANENLDEEIGMSTQYMPSSMGLTFLVKGKLDFVRGSLSFATYRNARVSDCIIPYFPEKAESYTVPAELAHLIEYDHAKNLLRLKSAVKKKEIRDIFEKDTIPEDEFFILKQIMYRFVDYCSAGYVREPHIVPDFVLDFSDGDYVDNEKTQKLDGTEAKLVALRKKLGGDLWSITIMLVNDLEESPAKANHCIFQPYICIDSSDNNFVFADTNTDANVGDLDEEEQSLDLLYRHRKTFGTGLGTSVSWKIDDIGNGRIWNDFFPTAEIPSMSFSLPKNDLIKDCELSMKYLSDLDQSTKEEKLTSMEKLVDLYKLWVDELDNSISELDSRYQTAAAKNIAECKRAYERMYASVEALGSNEKAYNAFLLANRAMFMQRIHIAKQAEMATENADRYPEDEEISNWLNSLNYYSESDENSKWRPFQIAFLLMDVISIIDDSSSDRSIVDLIWFPTGGGKTEAYLGLTAFTIFYRKMAHPEEAAGTAVIMRYTLRLLAAQQFTRAATLICACEFIRQDSEQKRHKYPSYPLGKSPITIGLWIGGTHIPNYNEGSDRSYGAKEYLEKLTNVPSPHYVRNAKERYNKFQVLKCPWCGTKMVKDEKDGHLVGEWGYGIKEKRGKHFYLFCPHEDCHFTSQLPIQIIDEELYKVPPTLLFGTVDKFAMLPWDGRVGSFFGINSCNRTPELIIQDELHLISGALGTIVGLFETAIDALCGQKGVSPKIIASTATIRRAKEQCSVLYNREVVQFPAPGLDAEDSFFAKESTVSHEKGVFGRKYVGIMPSGKTKAMTEIRMMAALLQKVFTSNLADEIKDKLWTLTVYFNSLKDLGKASTLIDDDVKDFIIRTANRLFTGRRLIVNADELTSRVSTTELNETLDKLEKIEYSKANIDAKKYASSVLLATNMISVGIDVARLNVMLMVGQPKLTSEYIQASSRVGRSYPGVVFVQYDATKSRDRSHYERFRSYHESFYRFVEPTGATPFSKPARERALHSVLIAMLRNKAGLSEDRDAINFDKEYFSEDIDKIEAFILKRVNEINERADGQATNDVEEVRSEIHDFFDKWQSFVDECNSEGKGKPLYFGRRYMVTPPGESGGRLLRQYNSSGKDNAINTLTSMRNVDVSVLGSVIIWGNDNV